METEDKKEYILRSHAHKDWAGEKKSSMKRRCEEHDYRERGIYMVTMVVEGRRPILGRLVGKSDADREEERPHVELTAFGERVRQEWEGIPRYYPMIEMMKLCVMPDHIHGVLFVHERMEKHLGQVINGFKAGTRRAARELGLLPQYDRETAAAKPMNAAAKPQPTQPQTGRMVGYAAVLQQQKKEDRAHGTIWEKNYTDGVLWAKGRLKHMLEYIDDNPRRLAMKHEHPEYFTRLQGITAAGIEVSAMGNRFLLNKPMKIQVQCSRSMTAEEIEHYKTNIITQARSLRAAIISPCISPGEQQTATAALEAGIPLVVLLLRGLSPLFKPGQKYLQACIDGRLLMLSPYPFQNEKIENMRERCLALNALAKRICEE